MKSLKKIYNTLYSFYGPQHWWPGDTPFEIAVGAILTQNTNWGNVEKAIKNLKDAKALSVKAINAMQISELAAHIKPAGYFNVKAKRLKAFIDFIYCNYRGKIAAMKKRPLNELRLELLNVHGIGHETADSILLYALDKPVFVIDAYTRRVLSRHKILNYNASYDEYQSLFHKTLDEDVHLFNEYHALFVRVGKEYCRPKPMCEQCPIRDFKPSSRVHL